MKSLLIFIIAMMSNVSVDAQILTPLKAESNAEYASQIQLAPFLKIVEAYVQSSLPDDKKDLDIPGIFRTIGLTNINSLYHRNKITDGSWSSTLQLNTSINNPGIFKLMGNAPAQIDQPFYAPASTDIATQISLKLDAISAFLTELSQHTQQQEKVRAFLEQPIGNSTLNELLSKNVARIHLAVDFDDKVPLQLGKIQIGRPHVLFRIDGINPLVEKLITHYIKTRGIPLTRTEEGDLVVYRLPKLLMLASAGYLPIISLNQKSNSTSIASSENVLSMVSQAKSILSNDPQFIQTWQNMPKQSQFKFYISKRLLMSTQNIYLRALKEEWTDNPTFLANRPLITQLVTDLNSSPSGLAFSLTSKTKQQEIKLESPFPSLLILAAILLQY